MRNKKVIKIISGALTIASMIAMNPIGANAEWKKNSTGWWYAEGSSWATGWRYIDGKWYYFDNSGYMLHDRVIDGYELGEDGAWINKDIKNDKQYIGFNQMPLSTSTNDILREFYNLDAWELNDIKSLSIAGKDYLNVSRNGQILGADGTAIGSDYIFDLNGKYNKFTALAGMDDWIGCNENTYEYNAIKNGEKGFGITITCIADGIVLDTKEIYYGDEPVKIELNDLSKYNKLILRVKCEAGIRYDILDGKFYYN